MENGTLIAVIAVLGTLAGAVVSTIGTYFVQKSRHERETKQERERDKIRIRRELLSKRLDVIEEAANIMMFLTSILFDDKVGADISCDTITFQKKKQRVEEIYLEARTSAHAINSKELVDAFGEMSSKFWEITNEGIVVEDYDEVLSNYTRVIKTIDDIKVNA